PLNMSHASYPLSRCRYDMFISGHVMVKSMSAMLTVGARILLRDPGMNPEERLSLSAGVLPVREVPALVDQYVAGAYVPRRPWRTPTTAEAEILLFQRGADSAPWQFGSDIAAVRIPDEIISPFIGLLEAHGARERVARGAYTSV